MESKCPVCSRVIKGTSLERHVNSCLDTLEATQGRSQDDESDDSKKRSSSSAFGMLMNSSKLNKPDNGKPMKTRGAMGRTRGEEKARSSSTQSLDEQDTSVMEVVTIESKDEAERKENKENESNNLNGAVSQTSVSKESIYLRKAKDMNKLKQEASIPLAHRLRPKTLDDYVGQEKLLGVDGILRNMIEADTILPFILWGPPGVGKTTLIRIIASKTDCKFIELSGADANSKKIREVVSVTDNEFALTGRKTIIFLDEIHRFNKAVQDLFLPIIEKGEAIIIGATTENPSFTLNNALLSRMHTFIMEKLSNESLEKILIRALYYINKLRINLYGLHYISLKQDALKYIANISQGDSRIALNLLESLHAYLSIDKYSFEKEEGDLDIVQIDKKPGVIKIDAAMLQPLLSTRNYHQMYDRQGENHYDTISALHKSVRGSNADAAIYYLAKMLAGGEDPLFIARRMIVMASEDIGLRDSSCLPFAVAVKDAIEFIGMPEGEIILAHCAVKLARAPKSTKSYRALRSAQTMITETPDLGKLPIPMHLRNAPTQLMKDLGYGDTYKYNPQFLYGKVDQKYLPPEIADKRFVEDTHMGTEVDRAVSKETLEKCKIEDEDYAKFKKYRKAELKSLYLNKLKETDRKLQSKEGSDYEPTSSYSYDEFLSKEDQPQYFDGKENDEYSDDPDCTSNFEKPFDEFLETDSQPDYFDGATISEDFKDNSGDTA